MLYLFEDAVFSPSHDGFSSGKIVIQNTEGLIIAEDNSRIELIGDNEDDPYVVFTEEGRISTPANMEMFRFLDCKVLFRNGDYPIISECRFSAHNVTFDVQSNLVVDENHPDIFLYNRSVITNSDFKDVRIVINNYGAPLLSGYFLNMVGNDFDFSYTLDQTQLVLNGGNINIMNCEFSGFSDVCLELAPTTYSQIYNSNFTGESFEYGATPITHLSNAELYVYNSSFNSYTTAIIESYGKLRLKCNTFDYSLAPSIIGNSGAAIDMSMNAGYNIFLNQYHYNIKLSDAKSIYLTNGYNYFNDVDEIPTIYGTMQVDGPLLSMILGMNNRWNAANAVPAASEFQIHSSITGNPILFLASSPSSASCGLYDPNIPIVDHAGGTGNYLPTITVTGQANSMRLDSAVIFAGSSTTLWDSTQNDLVAITRFYDILTNPYSLQALSDTATLFYLNYAYEWMKHTIYHAISDSVIFINSNQSGFSTPVQQYVDVLNNLTSSDTIEQIDYVKRFYLELDKAHLFRVIGYADMGLNILQNLDLCPLDSNEQIVLNEWKFIYEEEIAKQALGNLGFGSEIVLTDVSGYHQPISNQINKSYFGSTINSISDMTYRGCAGGTKSPINTPNSETQLFKIYPNPSQGNFTIEYDIPEESYGELMVYTLDGKKVFRLILKSGHQYERIDLTHAANGIYIYRFIINDETTKSGKVSISK